MLLLTGSVSIPFMTVVSAGVVPAMKELLVGLAAADLSQKAARKVCASYFLPPILHPTFYILLAPC